MRKPVAPGELMQLQKPVGRPAAPAPRRPDAPTKAGAGAGTATPPVARPNAPSAPRRPRVKKDIFFKAITESFRDICIRLMTKFEN